MAKPTLRPLLLVLTLLAAGRAGLAAEAGRSQPLESIREAVADFLSRQTPEGGPTAAVEVGYLDPRLQLDPCEEPLAVTAPGSSALTGSVTVLVRCPGPSAWKIYVPARVKVLDRVVVLTRPARPGTPLTADDVQVEERDVAGLTGGYLRDPGAAVGRTLKRPLAAGQPLGASNLEGAVQVRRGTRVVLVARVAGVDVRMQGEALRDGAVGDTILVRNLSSSRVVEGRVTASGQVEVAM
jgi:flagella basal body P-ring formation protein FlgA